MSLKFCSRKKESATVDEMAEMHNDNQEATATVDKSEGVQIWSARMAEIAQYTVQMFTRLGAQILHISAGVLSAAGRGIRCLSRQGRRLAVKMARASAHDVKWLGNKLAAPFVRFGGNVRHIAISVRQAHEQKENVGKAFFKSFAESFQHSGGIVMTFINYAAPVVAILFLITVVQDLGGKQYAISVEYNGQHVGYIENEGVFDTAAKALEERITYVDGNEQINLTPEFTVTTVSADMTLSSDQLTDRLIRSSSDELAQAYGLYIDDEFYGAVTDHDQLKQTLDSLLDRYRTGAGGEEVSFVNQVELKEGLYLTSSIKPTQELCTMVSQDKQGQQIYTVVEGDSPSLIASKNNLSMAELRAINSDLDAKMFPGEEVVVATSEPFLPVQVTKQITYDVEIPYDTVEVQDSNTYKNIKRVTQEGKNGLQQVTASVQMVNGVEVDRTILETKVVSEPVDKTIAVGTKALPVYSSYSGSSSGSLLWPLAGGQISQYYMNNGHRGVDIRAPYGTPIYAAEDGRVTLSQTWSTYGKCVVIDHGGGLTTLYAHASTLIAKPGQTVKKGDVIALVGSTGNSTGNHLHFEVKVNGRLNNPLNFIQ